MEPSLIEKGGVRIVEGAPGQGLVERPQQASRILSACFTARTRAALLYPENLTPGFFDLSTGEAGEILQKLRSFRVRLAIVCVPGSVRFSSRFTEILADDLKVFESRDAALEWLAREQRVE
jgi:uncharacterized protein DUF4180